MKNFSIAFLAAVSLMSFGCKKKPGGGDALAKMAEFKDQMCKCADKACADKVNEAFMKWGKDMAGEGKEPPKMNEEDTKKQQDIGKAYGECMAKLMMPPPPPAANAPAGDKPADPAAPAPAGDKPADPAAPPPAAPAGDKPADKPAGAN